MVQRAISSVVEFHRPLPLNLMQQARVVVRATTLWRPRRAPLPPPRLLQLPLPLLLPQLQAHPLLLLQLLLRLPLLLPLQLWLLLPQLPLPQPPPSRCRPCRRR